MHFVISFQHLDGRRWSCVNKITVIFSLTLRFSQFNWLFNNIGNIKMENLQLWHNFQKQISNFLKNTESFRKRTKDADYVWIVHRKRQQETNAKIPMLDEGI